MIGWLPLFLTHIAEQDKKQKDANYESPLDIDITEISGWHVLIGFAIGLSPFILAFSIIMIKKWIN